MNGLREYILDGKVSFLKAEEEFERGIILDALKRTNYVQSHAAEMLGISRRILKYKMDKLGINRDNLKDFWNHYKFVDPFSNLYKIFFIL